ncbi:hypothetical protein BCR43DRAFT_492885 [Syncephalastrum racemosum]|uniref:RING-type domain-containing protein n=1 Tax=Syncephalastrum racemosum TaxID=13706 RepID=A0A1X2H9M1_SYNRA|nr:hypothetical protein BCR43DRAFT_492885 [Syncephalastrum racemosum]
MRKNCVVHHGLIHPYLDMVDSLCPVCLDDFVLHEAICELPCSHLFHERCIFPWLKATGGPCPLCRAWVRPNLDKLMRTNVA